MGCLGTLLAIGFYGALIIFTGGCALPFIILYLWASTRDPFPNEPTDGSDTRTK